MRSGSPEAVPRVLLVLGALLTAFTLFYSAVGEEWIRPVLERHRRKAYYEKQIAPRGLSLHEALFWRKEAEAPPEAAREGRAGPPGPLQPADRQE